MAMRVGPQRSPHGEDSVFPDEVRFIRLLYVVDYLFPEERRFIQYHAILSLFTALDAASVVNAEVPPSTGNDASVITVEEMVKICSIFSPLECHFWRGFNKKWAMHTLVTCPSVAPCLTDLMDMCPTGKGFATFPENCNYVAITSSPVTPRHGFVLNMGVVSPEHRDTHTGANEIWVRHCEDKYNGQMTQLPFYYQHGVRPVNRRIDTDDELFLGGWVRRRVSERAAAFAQLKVSPKKLDRFWLFVDKLYAKYGPGTLSAISIVDKDLLNVPSVALRWQDSYQPMVFEDTDNGSAREFEACLASSDHLYFSMDDVWGIPGIGATCIHDVYALTMRRVDVFAAKDAANDGIRDDSLDAPRGPERPPENGDVTGFDVPSPTRFYFTSQLYPLMLHKKWSADRHERFAWKWNSLTLLVLVSIALLLAVYVCQVWVGSPTAMLYTRVIASDGPSPARTDVHIDAYAEPRSDL